MQLSQAIEIVSARVFHISTQYGSGTGFLVGQYDDDEMLLIATAAHVVEDAHEWEQPIRLTYAKKNRSCLLHATDRAVLRDKKRDLAVIMCEADDITRKRNSFIDTLELPDTSLPLTPESSPLKMGSDIGWLGFPSIASDHLCYFSGVVSAYLADTHEYLVDGVAIHGVSGGPAFVFNHEDDQAFPQVIGVVTAYAPNRAIGPFLPGLSVVEDASLLYETDRACCKLDEVPKRHARTNDNSDIEHDRGSSGVQRD